MTWKYILLAFVGGNAALAAVTAVGCGGSSGSGTGGQTTSSSSHTVTHTTSSSTATTSAPGTGNLGAACAADADCGGGGLTCALPSVANATFGGGPANGYCTKTCNSDNDCPSGGACVPEGSAGTCVLTCTQGPAIMHINDPISDMTKCLARPDVACTQITTSQYACLPLCGSDSQCPAGLHCDPRASVCVGTPNPGLAMGKPCAVDDAGVDPCSGDCLTINVSADGGEDLTSICTDPCVMGVDPTASAPTSWAACGGIKNGLCLYSGSGEGAGDQGFCSNACKKQDDCFNPNFFCYAITNLTGTSGITNGWCFPGNTCATNADCTLGTCVQTAYGMQCLSAQFPLGSAAPDGGTTTTDGGSETDGGSASDASTD